MGNNPALGCQNSPRTVHLQHLCVACRQSGLRDRVSSCLARGRQFVERPSRPPVCEVGWRRDRGRVHPVPAMAYVVRIHPRGSSGIPGKAESGTNEVVDGRAVQPDPCDFSFGLGRRLDCNACQDYDRSTRQFHDARLANVRWILLHELPERFRLSTRSVDGQFRFPMHHACLDNFNVFDGCRILPDSVDQIADSSKDLD